MTADDWITLFDLQQHPEGGWFVETYRSETVIAADALPSPYLSERSAATSIYYLLKAGEKSHFHRLRSDELWFFHAGSPMRLHIIEPSGEYSEVLLGVEKRNLPQCRILAESWFAAEPVGEFALVGCVVAPGFEFDDFELASREDLISQFPQHASLVENFTAG